MVFSLTSYIVPKGGLINSMLNVLIGFFLPLVIDGITLGACYHDYGENGCMLVIVETAN